jgi:NADPH2:quinone reductase
MRAVMIREFNNYDAVKVEEVDDPVPGDGQVLVDVKAAGINYTDWMSLHGTYQNIPDMPFTPGKDVSGFVKAVGAGVTKYQVGDRVLGHVNDSALAEKAVVDEPLTCKIPDGVEFVQSAGLGLSYMTAWYGLVERGGMKAGDSVLITGASGGVGMSAVQIAKALGAKTVVGGVNNMEKGAAVLAAGADAVVDQSTNPKDEIRNQLKEKTGEPGVNICLEMIGGEVFDGAFRTILPRGCIVVCGFVTGKVPQVRTNILLVKNIGVLGMTMAEPFAKGDPLIEAAQTKIFELLEAGRLNPDIQGIYPLDDFMTPIQAMGNRTVVGKSVLVME